MTVQLYGDATNTETVHRTLPTTSWVRGLQRQIHCPTRRNGRGQRSVIIPDAPERKPVHDGTKPLKSECFPRLNGRLFEYWTLRVQARVETTVTTTGLATLSK